MLNATIKPKTCENCGKVFTPRSSFQTVCGSACLLRQVNRQEREKKAAAKAEAKAHRAALSKSRETIPKLIAAAQIEFNAYIRERDREKGCFVCHRPFLADVPGRVMHAGHVRSRGAAGHLRFNENNCLGECEGCNGPHGAKPHEIKAGAIERIGLAAFEALEADNEPVKWDRDTLRQLKTIYRAKARQLLKERG
jgi:hypothetical protein